MLIPFFCNFLNLMILWSLEARIHRQKLPKMALVRHLDSCFRSMKWFVFCFPYINVASALSPHTLPLKLKSNKQVPTKNWNTWFFSTSRCRKQIVFCCWGMVNWLRYSPNKTYGNQKTWVLKPTLDLDLKFHTQTESIWVSNSF